MFNTAHGPQAAHGLPKDGTGSFGSENVRLVGPDPEVRNSEVHNSEVRDSKAFSLKLRHQLRCQLLALPYRSFLQVILHLLTAEQYEEVHPAGRAEFVGRNHAGGWDMEALLTASNRLDDSQNRTPCIVQAKQFDHLEVQQRTVDELRGCCLRAGASQGLLITTSRFSPVARRAAEASAIVPILLVDGERLLDLLVRHRLGILQDKRGRWQVDSSFFQSLAAEADVPHKSAERSNRAECFNKPEPACPQVLSARLHHKTVEAQTKEKAQTKESGQVGGPTVLHFSITLGAGHSGFRKIVPKP